MAHALIHERQTVSPRRLSAPGPTDKQLERMLHAAAAAPDHGLLVPWRFVLVPVDKRHLLGEVFALALIDRDPTATLEQIEDARVKAYRAPMLMLAVARLGTEEPNTPPLERMVSLGCAIQNILLSAQSMGFGSGLTSGRAMNSARMRVLFSLCDGEEAVCFINIGTVIKSKPPRMRPTLERFISKLE
jgi:nitroreductase